MIQAAGLLLLSAILLVTGGFVGKLAWKAYDEADTRKSYTFRYFEGSRYLTVDEPRHKDLRKRLDTEKRKADEELIKIVSRPMDKSQLHRTNDYTFRILRDIYQIEEAWREQNGRYFQGKNTMRRPPSYREIEKVDLGFGLTDQLDSWRDVGYADIYASVRFKVDVYEGPQGHGFIVTVETMVDGRIWRLQAHSGPENRGIKNFRWQKGL